MDNKACDKVVYFQGSKSGFGEDANCPFSQEIISKLKSTQDEVSKMRSAFPDGDPAGHCAYHLIIIEREKQRIKLRQAIIEKTLSGLIWMAIVFLGASVWKYFVSAVTGGK